MTKNNAQVLFSHLDEVERCEIFDAMFPAFARPGHLIIKQVVGAVVVVAVVDDVYVVILFLFLLVVMMLLILLLLLLLLFLFLLLLDLSIK